MRRYPPNPRDAGVLHRHGGVEALGHRLVDEGGALLGQQVQELALLLDQGVDGGGLFVEVVGDGFLGGERRKGNYLIEVQFPAEVLNACCLLNRPGIDLAVVKKSVKVGQESCIVSGARYNSMPLS